MIPDDLAGSIDEPFHQGFHAYPNKRGIRVGKCHAPTLATMSEATITKRLLAHLNEVYFVFRHLPDRLLGIARALSASNKRESFIQMAHIARAHRARLLAALMFWGKRPGPCLCEEVSEQLNELRYTAKAKRGAEVVLERAMRATDRLTALVRKRLSEALRLSRSIREDELADRLEELLRTEPGTDQRPGTS